jgi:dihydrofolate reductase
MVGKEGGATGTDGDFVARGFEPIGARILGRNMFGPIRESWPDDSWKGWWGENPPYHNRFRPHASLEMSRGTTFHFVTDGIHAALERAVKAAKGRDVRLGGGVATIQQYLRAGVIDKMHLAMSPVLLGSGECLLEGIDAPKLGYHRTEHVATPNATHFVIAKRT